VRGHENGAAGVVDVVVDDVVHVDMSNHNRACRKRLEKETNGHAKRN
jgi:hypothetical protein